MPKPRVVRHEVVQPLGESYRYIPLTRGQTAIVDLKDFAWLSQWNWRAHWSPGSKSFYAVREASTKEGNRDIKMARLIMGEPSGREVDHWNHDTLDNRKQNLRKCTHAQNGKNRGKQANNTSGFKGVCWNKLRSKWIAQLEVNKKHVNLGYFAEKEEAAHAYDEAAKFYHREFAQLNFPS